MQQETTSGRARAALELQDVCVSFPLYHGGSRSLKKSLLYHGTKGKIASDASHRVVVEALRNVSLRFSVGDRIALVGSNGAGKTTLLRVMAGIYEPVSGSVQIFGRISPMFDLGLGVDMELSGLENIRLRALVLDISSDEIEAKLEEIVSFTELGDYLTLPVRTYSSGMIARLNFAVATCFTPEILLMDEWIVAGDANFMAKAEHRISSFIADASILVLASHNEEICKRWCNKAVLLEEGTVKATGTVDEVLAAYHSDND
jgi:ABC-type polysaccharide/polyol phosphate transport system ATPase subunit